MSVVLKKVNETDYLEINGTNNSKYKLHSYAILDKFANPNFSEFESNLVYFKSSSSANGTLDITYEAQDGKYQGLSGCRYGYNIFESIELTEGWNYYLAIESGWLACA